MRLDRRKALIQRQQEAHAVDGESGVGNLVVQFSGEGERQLIDRQAENDARVCTAVHDEFTLRVVEVALERHHGTAKDDASMTAASALDAAIAEWDTQRFALV